ncbi:MAG: phage tail protein I [Campylobacteraceae bacterium]|jgi:phage tail P2-like protein|nr:phage tail protein I [Campylobacteraceae bacterium]
MVETLLPAHKSAIEKALDILAKEEFESIDLSAISILPATCPAKILPHLAESFDVDIAGLNEAETRELLQDAFLLHYYAGTPYSINRALAIIFAEAKAQEWFDYGGEAYYFRILINSGFDITGINQELFARLIKTANRYKNARSLIDKFLIDAEIKGNIYIGSAAQSGITTTIYPSNSADILTEGEIFFAGVVHTAYNITIEADKQWITI